MVSVVTVWEVAIVSFPPVVPPSACQGKEESGKSVRI